MSSLLNMSGGSLLSKGLPYDAEIEYLESTGTQWIVTNLIPSNDSTIIIDGGFRIVSGDSTFFSAATTWAFGKWMMFSPGGRGTYWAVADAIIPYSSTPHQEYKIIGSSLYINDTLTVSYPFRASQVETTLHLFCHGNKSKFSKGKIYRIKFSDNLNSADLIPVRVGQVGYMYDKVSKQLFGNNGTGAFILGPDK